TVTSIGNSAFYGCTGLSSLIIGNSVTRIGNWAFSGCSGLKKAAYPNTLKNPFVNDSGIAYNPEGAIIEEGWIYGPDKAEIRFAPYDLEGEYIIPDSVTSIGNKAFEGCDGLTSIVALSSTPPTMQDNSFEQLYDKINLSIPQEATTNYLLTNWALFTNLHLGDTGQEVSTYNDGVLNYRLIPAVSKEDNNLAVIISGDYSGEISIPERFTDDRDAANPTRYYIESIGYKAFSGGSVSKIEFNSRINLEYIGDYAFSDCWNLSNIILPETVKTLGEYAFNNCTSLDQITIPKDIIEIKKGTFYNCYRLLDIKLNSMLERIGDKAFAIDENNYSENRKANDLKIPATLRYIGDD
ncbi:MAG: leucine-rich repeat domain-containing protein, partial [Muribaculaceae bacterium]|nr:leucine-rich repeat domain-containing protein [Muribaculaceae bacterium]